MDATCTAYGCIRPVYAKNRGLCKPHHLIFLRNGSVLPTLPESDEEWRIIPGFEGYYAASDWGRIWSIRRCRTLIQAQLPEGYLRVTLCVEKQRFQLDVHSVIARTFLGACPRGLRVLHGDNIRCHNIPSNLRYGTQAENIQQSVQDGTHVGLMANRMRLGLDERMRHRKTSTA